MGCAALRGASGRDQSGAAVLTASQDVTSDAARSATEGNAIRWYRKHFTQDKVLRGERRVKVGRRSVAVCLLETEYELVFATAGLATKIINDDRVSAARAADMGDSSAGHELVLRLRKTPGDRAGHHPQWAIDMFVGLLQDGAKSLSLLSGSGLVAGRGDEEGAEPVTVSDFLLVPAAPQRDGIWAPGLTGISFLFLVGLTSDEAAWCKANSAGKFVDALREAQPRAVAGSTKLSRPSLLHSHPQLFGLS